MKNIWARQTSNLISGESEKHAQHCGERRQRYTKLCGSQHAQKEVHGLMEAALCFDDKEDCTISQDGNNVHAAERDSKPQVPTFHSWDSCYKEGRRSKEARNVDHFPSAASSPCQRSSSRSHSSYKGIHRNHKRVIMP